MGLLSLFKNIGVKGEFESCIEPHMEYLFRLAYRLHRNTADAEDLVQELLAKVYVKRSELKKAHQAKMWLSKVMYHLFIDGIRKNALQASFHSPTDLNADDLASDNPGPDLIAHSDHTQQKIESAYLQLSPEHRAVLSMHDMEGYTLIELEQMLAIPLGTLKSRLHRARANMKRMLTEMRDQEISTASRNLPKSA